MRHSFPEPFTIATQRRQTLLQYLAGCQDAGAYPQIGKASCVSPSIRDAF
jgi:hypothetical protein